MKIRALVFDFDGLILDTESVVFESWRHCYREHGQQMPRERWLSSIGSDSSHFDPLAHLVELLDQPLDVPELQKRRRLVRDSLLAELTPMPGVVGTLEQAERDGLCVGLASSSERDWVEGHLKRLELRHHFETVRSRDDVARVKPDPELYVSALARLGVEPRDALAFEDSPNGVAAAVAAGLRVVAVPGPMTRGLDFDRAHLVVESLDEQPLGALLERLATR